MQDDNLSDKVFDSLVEELVTGQRPPDLSARILSAWQAEQRSSKLAQHGKSSSGGKPKIASWMAIVAACLLLGFVGWSLIAGPGVTKNPKPLIADNDLGKSGSNGNNNVGQNSSDSNKGSPTLTDSKPPKSNSSQPTPREAPEKITAPFELDSDLVKRPQADSPALVSSSQKRPDAEIVAELDRRMNELWSSQSVTPSASLSPAELAQRISQTLTGQQVSDAQLKQWIDAKKQQLNSASLIASGVDSVAFERFWSQRLVQHWLGRSTKGDAESALVESLATQMGRQKQWNVVVSELIGGELQEDSLSNQFYGLLAGGENHRLVECIGKNFMNQQVACMRCHAQPDRESSESHQQSAYWSLVGLLKGIEPPGAGQLVNDRQHELFRAEQSPGIYYELPSGVLKQTFAQLPEGKNWRSESVAVPRQALGKWIAESNSLDQATVNLVWQIIYGRPLVPQVPSVDVAGLEQREATLNFLAEQFDASGHNLKNLIGWIVSSRAFASQNLAMTRDQWIETDDRQLEARQLADRVFATGVQPAASPLKKRLKDNLEYVVQWRASEPNALLAQPAPQSPNTKVVPAGKQEAPFSMDFAIHGLRHSATELAYVDRILRTEKLTWADRVQHIVGLSSMTQANDDGLQFAAKELLQHHSGDAKSALLDLLWAVQVSQL
jgi:Protein of unknown function (DUF1553)